MEVFKFGGASLKDAQSIKNIVEILNSYHDLEQLVVVVSAMGKTTNAFEKFLSLVYSLSLIHISEPTRLLSISYAVFCLKKKKKINTQMYH